MKSALKTMYLTVFKTLGYFNLIMASFIGETCGFALTLTFFGVVAKFIEHRLQSKYPQIC